MWRKWGRLAALASLGAAARAAVGLGLAQLLDAKADPRQRLRIRLQWPVDALEGHLQPVELDLLGEAVLDEVVVQSRGWAVERMHDRQAEPPAGLEHAGDLRDGVRRGVDVMQ